MEERLFWLAFSLFPGIGPGKFGKLLTYFGSAKDAWHASLTDVRASGVGEMLATSFVRDRDAFSIRGYVQRLKEQHIIFVTLTDPQYPQRLLEIKNAPIVLFVNAKREFDFNAPDKKPIAIVGTRKVTEYGRQVTEMLTRELVEAGCTIISGLALGVDGIAHQATLAASGVTVAVLGCGVDCCYPRENQLIYNRIIESGGAIVSEYGLGVQPNKGSFPSRNRIIAGLSLGVLVTEGASQSGSLITAEDAFANNRPVFAVPGPITSSLSKGPYELIQKGAKLVTNGKEILEGLGISRNPTSGKLKQAKGDTAEEQRIIDLLGEHELHFDELVRKTMLESSLAGSLLSILEMKGVVKSSDGIFSLALDG